MTGWSDTQLRIIENFRERHQKGEKWTFDEMAKALNMPVEDLKQRFVQSMADRGIKVRETGRVQ